MSDAGGGGCRCGGCCSGVQLRTPVATYNPPGQAALARRVGTHGSFLETMTARLSGRTPLAALTARTTEDFSIALLDAWAVIADVLTFYQERIANEGYLATATEAFSVFELGRLVGYAPRPALGAGCYLAYSLEPGASAVIPAGSQIKSVSTDGSQPQTFETTEELLARDEWSNLVPRRAALAFPGGRGDAESADRITLAGAALNIKPADRLLVLFGTSDPMAGVVADVSADFTAGVTRLTLVRPPGQGTAVDQAVAALSAAITAALAHGPASIQAVLSALTELQNERAEQSAAGVADQLRQLREQVALARPHAQADVRTWLDRHLEPLLAAADALQAALQSRDHVVAPEIRDATRAAALTLCPDSGPRDVPGRNGDCDRGAALAALAPILPALRKPPSQPPVSARVLPTNPAQDFAPDSDVNAKLLAAADSRLAPVLYQAWRNAAIAPPGPMSGVRVMRVKARGTVSVEGPGIVVVGDATTTTLVLDAVYDSLLPGSWVVVDGGGATTPAQIRSTAQSMTSVTEALTVSKTMLTVTPALPEGDDYVVWGAGEAVQPLGEPIIEPVSGAEIELDRVYDGLTAGRWLVVAGERTDVPFTSGVAGVELSMISAVRQRVDPMQSGDSLHTVIELATPLAYSYRRDALTVYGNVVAATQGETRSEVLGSGDGSVAGQGFTLRQVDAQHPLTALPADNPLGFERAAVVRVNGVAWRETDVLALADPTAHVYSVRTTADSASVGFGDGLHGARLPTGLENVTARYRCGAGSSGNVSAGQITQLVSRPLGVNGVTNPIAASGGSRGDGPDDARAVTPLRMLALDRLVSDIDYENFTRARAGIGKAAARRLTDGTRQVVHVTIAGVDDAPIEPTAPLVTALRSSLADFGDPPLPVMVAVRELVRIVLAAGVHVEADHSWDLVEPAVRAALLDALGFAHRNLGEPAFLSTAIAAAQAVPGVDYVEVDVFAGVRADATPLELITLATRLDGAQPCIPARLAEWQSTTVVGQSGDTLTALADANGLTLDELVALNSHLTGNDPTGVTLTVSHRFAPAQLAALTGVVPETLRLRRIP
jgi:predicted phage baseplate assembly protein